MEKFPCTCRGENPNCFKCDGTGMVARPEPKLVHPGISRVRPVATKGTSAQAAPPEPARASKGNRGSATHREPIFCRLCERSFVFAADLLEHLREAHSPPTVGPIVATTRKRSRRARLVPCPVCGDPVGDVAKHVARLHTPEGLQRREESKNRRKAAKRKRASLEARSTRPGADVRQAGMRKLEERRHHNPQALLCGFCYSVLESSEELLKHLHDAHGLKRQSASAPRKRLVGEPSGVGCSAGTRLREHVAMVDADRGPTDPYEQERRERRMDATYGMGGTARDHGRFGSAASYDGMDDESSP